MNNLTCECNPTELNGLPPDVALGMAAVGDHPENHGRGAPNTHTRHATLLPHQTEPCTPTHLPLPLAVALTGGGRVPKYKFTQMPVSLRLVLHSSQKQSSSQ